MDRSFIKISAFTCLLTLIYKTSFTDNFLNQFIQYIKALTFERKSIVLVEQSSRKNTVVFLFLKQISTSYSICAFLHSNRSMELTNHILLYYMIINNLFFQKNISKMLRRMDNNMMAQKVILLCVSSILFVLMSVETVNAKSDFPNWNTGEGGVKWLPNCDFPGHDIGNRPSAGDRVWPPLH